MRQDFEALSSTWTRLNEARASLERRRREKALLEAQIEEIARARLRAGEEEELRSEKNIWAHAEKLHQGCRDGEELLYAGEGALAGRLAKYAARLKELAGIDENFGPASGSGPGAASLRRAGSF
jgi:DNA repair protein RecN (Recombination protein N)